MFTIKIIKGNRFLLSFIAQSKGAGSYPLYVKIFDTMEQCEKHIEKYSKYVR